MKLAVTIAAALTLATTALAGTDTTASITKSRNVIRFFDNHSWLRAPNQPNCAAVPWRKSCRIARRVYRHHHQRLARLEYDYQYNWRSWLPANWRRLGTCETGYGGDPNFEHSNSKFTSAFGISWAEYNADAAYMGAPPWNVRHTPRDQYKAALGHYARFGDGWSCPGP